MSSKKNVEGFAHFLRGDGQRRPPFPASGQQSAEAGRDCAGEILRKLQTGPLAASAVFRESGIGILEFGEVMSAILDRKLAELIEVDGKDHLKLTESGARMARIAETESA